MELLNVARNLAPPLILGQTIIPAEHSLRANSTMTEERLRAPAALACAHNVGRRSPPSTLSIHTSLANFAPPLLGATLRGAIAPEAAHAT